MTQIKHMFTLVRVGLAASVSVVAAYYTFQRLRNKSDTEPGRSLGNQFQNAEVKSTDEVQAQSYNKLCSVKKNYNSKSLSGNLFLPHAIGNRLPLVKRVDNAKLVVQKLKTIKEEDENPSSENPTQTAKINNIKLAEMHTRSSRVAKLPPKPSPSSNGTPVKGPPPSGKPTPPHPHPPPGALGVPPPPPPPPPPRGMLNIQGTTSEKLQRAPELVKFYHFLMNRKAKKEATTPTSAAAQSNIIAEIKNRSSFFLSVKADVETQGDFIQSLATEVRAAAYTNVEDIVSFMHWLDEELANLCSIFFPFLSFSEASSNQKNFLCLVMDNGQ